MKRVNRLSHFSTVIITANEEEISNIREHPFTNSVTGDISLSPLLSGAANDVHFELWRNLGKAGQGQIVAVIDGPIQTSHPMLNGRIIAEGCFTNSGTVGGESYVSMCPNGQSYQTGYGASGNFAPCATGSRCEYYGTVVFAVVDAPLTSTPVFAMERVQC